MSEKTMWQRISDALRAEGIDVYPPATKTGECTAPYTVVKADGSAQIVGFSSETRYFTVMPFVPKNQYTELERYKTQVKSIIADSLYPMIMPTGQETPDYYDDTVKAHTMSITYRNSARNEQL